MRVLEMVKKAVPVILTVFLAVSSVSSFASVYTGETAEEIMLNFDIIREVKSLEEEVTCAQYSAMLVRALGLDEVASAYTEQDWSYGYLDLGEKLRFYRAYNEMPMPHKSITVKTAVVMTVAALGYDVTAKYNAEDQYSVGVKIGLYKNVEAEAQEILCRKDAYELIAQALKTDLCVSVNYSGVGKYMIDEGNNLMELLLNLREREYREGVVEASYALTLTGTEVEKGEVIIDGVRYYAGSTDAEHYVGSYVRFYVDYDNNASQGTLYWIAAHKNNAVVELDNKSEKSIEEDEIISFPQVGKEEKYDLAETLKVMVNNREANRIIKTEDIAKNRVTLIDNNADSIYDIMLIIKPESYIVKRSYPEQGTISFESSALYDKNGISFQFGDKSYTYEFYDETGEKTEFSDFGEGDAVSLIASEDGKYIALYRLAKPIIGKLEEYDTAELTAIINGEEYSYLEGISDFSAGNGGSFYLDMWERVFELKESADSYVYISKIDRGSGLMQRPMLKVFTAESGFVSYSLADTVTIDGKRISDSDEMMAALQQETVATVRVKDSGEVSYIDYADVHAERGMRTYVENDFGFTDYTDKILTPFVCSKSQTAIFFIPKSGEEDEYYNTFPLLDDEDYIVTGYDFDTQNGKVRAVTVEMDVKQPLSSGFGASSKFMAVNSVRQILDGEDITYKLEGICEGDEVSFSAAQLQNVFNVLSTVDKGDVIQFVLNWDGKIGLVRKVMDYSTLNESYYDDSDYQNTQLFGKVNSVRENVMTNYKKYLAHEIMCEVNGRGIIPNVVSASETAVSGTDNKGFDNYFVFNKNKKKYFQGSIDFISSESYGSETASNVFILSQDGTVKFIVMIDD